MGKWASGHLMLWFSNGAAAAASDDDTDATDDATSATDAATDVIACGVLWCSCWYSSLQ